VGSSEKHNKNRSPDKISLKTKALSGSTKLSKTIEDLIRARLKQLAADEYGSKWEVISDDDYNALSRKVARELRASGNKVSTAQVRAASRVMRNPPEVKTGYPVCLEAEEYAFIAHKAETDGITMKAANSTIIRSYREQHA
jgi:hypothetical protein